MRALVLGIILSIVAVSSGFAFADSTYSMKGSGAAMINGDTPTLYTSSMRLSIVNPSTIDKGAILVEGSNGIFVARFTGDSWNFTYNNDGSFHAQGPAQTGSSDTFTVSLDGTRLYATTSGSMWKVSANMQDSVQKYVLSYLLLGSDPIPSVSVSNNAKILIPNGNFATASTGFYLPLNLEIIPGTTVTWQNQDNIQHDIQSIDSHGNIVPLFNSGLLNTGDTFSYKFDSPGVYHYYCTIHPWRIGTVTVS
ncbi:cupredoxin domain-containing protein [Candidatus Nitrosotalea bavarica]|uniref:cupredoxin domain-containing protein n=1 Tax=Candidatus Nitrosotalea bavarica TaxID=1903277 RepID=UPI001054FACD|nr:plastocyanin/azurin family copper-binding protein [Candidatus Nitrosotalea bavarica]